MLEEEFGEGWSSQQGEASLDSTVSENIDEVDSIDTDMTLSVVETHNRARSFGSKRKCKEVDQFIEAYVARNVILDQKNKLIEQMMEMMEREYTYSVERVINILNELPRVRKWSSFYCASIDHLLANAANRQGFIAFSKIEDKISFLEHRTRTKLDD